MSIPLGDLPVPDPTLEEEENKKKRAAAAKAKAADNAKKGMDPNGNKLKRKNTPQEQAPLNTRDPLKGVKDAINSNPVLKAAKDTVKETIGDVALPLTNMVPWEQLSTVSDTASEAFKAV